MPACSLRSSAQKKDLELRLSLGIRYNNELGTGTEAGFPRRALAVLLALVATGGSLAGCASSTASATGVKVVAVGAENEYANVISQVGGPYVSVAAIMSNPNTDPHEFEASASVAVKVSEAQLIVQNGVGYDSFMDKIEATTHRPGREVIVAQDLLGLSSTIFNPHLWYDPRTMPAVANAVASDLSRLQPAHRAFFQANAKRFDGSLRAWLAAIASFKAAHPGYTGGRNRTRSRLPARGRWRPHPDATFLCSRPS